MLSNATDQSLPLASTLTPSAIGRMHRTPSAVTQTNPNPDPRQVKATPEVTPILTLIVTIILIPTLTLAAIIQKFVFCEIQ